MRKIIIIFILFANSSLNLTMAFSEEVSTQGEQEEIETTSKPAEKDKAILEEIKWLHAEAFDLEAFLASRKLQKLSKTAAAISIITQEDIRRSSATNIPELLRMVSGMQVARIDANKWAVASRGFNARFTAKLLVLIDGRSIYTRLFSGVFWDVQNILLEDVERIEVIRGPGGSIWGSNAVNGIINIITKNSKDTQGGLLTGMGGTEERAAGGIRYGGRIGKDAYYRLYARYFNHDDFGDTMDGEEANDKWDVLHGGFRIDWDMSDKDSLVLKGDYYDGDGNELVGLRAGLEARNFDFSGGNLLTRWQHVYSDTSDMILQAYFDRTYRKAEVFREERHTFDLDFQHRFALGSRQELIWGLGYRFTTDGYVGFRGLQLDPSNRGFNIYSAFLQDEITIIRDRLRLTFGTKLEYNDYTGLEVMPTARILWTPFRRHTAWAAASRAVRIPSRTFRDIEHTVATFPLGPGKTGSVQILGTPDIESEKVHAYELGYRFQPIDRLSIDIAGFYNNYYDLQTGEEQVSFQISSSETVFPIFNDNEMDGDTYGVEISTDWNVTDSWKLKAGYTFLRMQLHLDKASVVDATDDDEEEGVNSRNRAHFLSYLNLPHNFEIDTALYYVDHLSTGDIPSYLRLDMRLGWQPVESLDVSVGVKNMLDGEHHEFPTRFDRLETTAVERSVYAKITWRF